MNSVASKPADTRDVQGPQVLRPERSAVIRMPEKNASVPGSIGTYPRRYGAAFLDDAAHESQTTPPSELTPRPLRGDPACRDVEGRLVTCAPIGNLRTDW